MPHFLNEKFHAKFLIDCDIETLENVDSVTVHLRILIFNDTKFITEITPIRGLCNNRVNILHVHPPHWNCPPDGYTL